MLPGMDIKNLQKMMKQMGVKSEEIEAAKVTIEKKDGSNLIIFEPQVIQIEIQGQKSFQISGKVEEQTKEDDVKMVMEAAKCTREQAINALRETGGNIAEAILRLEEG